MNYNNPFVKVTWRDTPESFTKEKLSSVKAYFQQKYNTKNIKLVTIPIGDTKNTKLKSLDISENILDENYQKTLMKDFIKENGIDIEWSLVERLDNRVNEELKKSGDDRARYSKWFLKRVEFSNFLSYGENNVIDFTGMDGITVVESNPKNFGGKTTATVDLLMYLFFNTTTKTKTNSEIFNTFTDEDRVSVRGEVMIDNEDYVIERTSTRKKGRSGDYTVSNKLEFSKRKPDGTIENLSGEQRRETEAFITEVIGTQEDFLSTILTTGNNLEELIESKPTARGLILTRFLGLEALKQKEEICKTIYNEWSKRLVSNTYNAVELENQIEEMVGNIDQASDEIEEGKASINNLKASLKQVEARREDLASYRNNDVDTELARVNPMLLQREIDDLREQKTRLERQVNDVLVIEPSQFYLEEDHDKLKTEINEWFLKSRYATEDIKIQERLVDSLEKGSVCPTCTRALDGVDHTDEISKHKVVIAKAKESVVEYDAKVVELREKEAEFAKLKVEYDEYERNKLRKARFELEVEQKELEFSKKADKMANYEKNKKKLEDNAKIDSEMVGIRTKMETLNAEITQAHVRIERLQNNIKNWEEKIVINRDLIKKIKTENNGQTTFKVYLSIYGKNGISKVILKNMIPLINQELHRLLMDSCPFILELKINDKNELDFVMIDTETRVVKPLSSGSGYEKTISSLALRSVLTKISSLPKPNIVVMDEVFGKIADENLEMVGEFFKKIKKYFEHIFVISHNPLIRNWSDNLMMVKKEDNVSAVDFISTKIS